jgi:cobalt-zinc-cadmium efflux system outer membrane protein
MLSFASLLAGQNAPQLTLQQLESMALRHNPTLGEAQDAVRAAAGQVKQAGLWPNPTVGYSAGRLRGGFVRGGDQGLFVQQSILLGGKLAAAQATARAAQAQSQVRASAQRTAVRTAVHIAYYHSLAAQERVTLAQQMVELADSAARTTQQLGNIGQADQPEVLQAQVEAGQAHLGLDQARFGQQQAWTQLAAVVGQPSLPLQRLQGKLEENLPGIDSTAYLQQLLTRSPDVVAAEAAQREAEARLHQQKRQAVPNLFVRAGIADNREISDLRHAPTGLEGSAEVGVEVPVFNRNQGNIASAGADTDCATLELERVRLSLRQQAAPLLAGYRSAQAAVTAYRTSLLPKARAAWQMYQNSYRHMAAPYSQVLLAQRTLFQLQSDYLRQLETLWVDAATLEGDLTTGGLQAVP